jgi:putative flippase GtrA
VETGPACTGRKASVMSMTTLSRQVVRYGAVGALGFLVDGGLLYLLVAEGVNPHYARLVSFTVALTVTWALNRAWTFQARGTVGAGRSYVGYLLVQLAGLLTNYLFYALVLYFLEPTPGNAVLGLAVGSFFGLLVNFTGARMVFTRAN